MVRPSRFLRALGAVTGSAALGLGLVLAAAPPSTADPTGAGTRPAAGAVDSPRTSTLKARTARKVQAAAAEASPLEVTISGLAPSYLPERGNVVVRGEVTNTTDETWTNVRLYAFLGDDLPAMRTSDALAAAMDEPADADVGDRIVDEGETSTDPATLAPGETSPYVVRVPATALRVPEGGVYWFGVHALGESPSHPTDLLADGRARTFLPYVPPRVTTPVKAALVLPLIRSLPYRSDGSIDLESKWQRSLSSGRLRDLLGFVGSAGSIPLTWVVDPALVDGIGRLADGNPPRSLAPTSDPEVDAGGRTPSAGDTATDAPEETSPPDTPTSRAAASWLAALPAALAGNEVLALPYGNIDVPAALAHGSPLYDVARAKHSDVLDGLGIATEPVLTSPTGYLDTASIRSAETDTRVLVSDRMFADAPPGVAEVDGHQLVVASSGAAAGSPGPGPSVTAVGLRQRIIAEAAVRALRADQPPLTVVLPTEWGLESPEEFFAGLDVDWLDLRTLSGLEAASTATPVSEDDLVYTPAQRRRELDATTFAAADSLVARGETLQSVLGENFSVAGVVTKEALNGLSFSVRDDESGARASIDASRAWIDERLGKVTISASAGVTLSSASGTFLVTLSNGLDEAVTVGVDARSDSELTVTAPDPVLLAPGSRTNMLLEVSTTGNRVHNVTLMVTDAQGVPLGDTDQIPIRSAQVSDVIWLIMGSGVGLLFLAIAIRLVRRVRVARRGAVVGGA